MYKVLTIGGKDYKLEYTVEAALYKDGIDRLIEFVGSKEMPEVGKQITKNMTEEEKEKVLIQVFNSIKSEITGLPNTALILFYSGLLEHHGPEGDGSVCSLADAKKLVKQLFSEQSEDGVSDFAELISVCFEQMGNDGFFKTTGLEKIMAQSEDEKPNRAARRANTKQLKTNS